MLTKLNHLANGHASVYSLNGEWSSFWGCYLSVTSL